MLTYDRSDAFEKLFKYLVEDRGYDPDLLQSQIYPETDNPPSNGWASLFRATEGELGVNRYIHDLRAPMTQTRIAETVDNSDLNLLGTLANRLIRMKLGY